MTIQEAQNLKQELESLIQEAIDSFEDRTGIIVNNIELIKGHTVGSRETILLCVRTEVMLP